MTSWQKNEQNINVTLGDTNTTIKKDSAEQDPGDWRGDEGSPPVAQ